MKELFSPEGPIMGFFSKTLDVIIISLVFTLTCLPVVTIGCSLTALYYALEKSVHRDGGRIIRQYFHSFKQNLKMGLVAGVINLLLLAVMALNFWIIFTTDLGNAGVVFGVIFGIITLMILIIMTFCYPILSRFECGYSNLLLSSLQLSLINPKVTFQVCVMELMLFAGMGFAFLVFPPVCMICPGVLILGQVKLLEPIFLPFMPEEEVAKRSNEILEEE